MQRRAAVSGCGPEAPQAPEAPEATPGKEEVQGRLLGVAAPVLHTARLFGLAPFRLVRPTPQHAAGVTPCPFWAAYSTLVLLLLGVALGLINYYLLVFATRNKRIDKDAQFVGMRSVMTATFFLKQAVAVTLTACCILKGGDVARVLEKLIRISSRLGLGARFLLRARWVVLVQVTFLFGWLGALGIRTFLKSPVAMAETPCLPALYLVNVQFTDAALLLRGELAALNQSLEALFKESRQAWAGPSFLTALAAKSSAAPWMVAPRRCKSGGGSSRLVSDARGAQRELRRAFLHLDEAFAVQNLAFIMVVFVHTTVVLYAVMVEGFIVWTTTLSMLVLLLQLLVTLTACQTTTDESRRTAVVVHRALLRDDLSDATRAELVDFSLQLLSAEMRFSAWGFFPMDYQLLQAFVGTVVTYIVIMVQFRSPKAPASAPANATAPLLSTTTS